MSGKYDQSRFSSLSEAAYDHIIKLNGIDLENKTDEMHAEYIKVLKALAGFKLISVLGTEEKPTVVFNNSSEFLHSVFMGFMGKMSKEGQKENIDKMIAHCEDQSTGILEMNMLLLMYIAQHHTKDFSDHSYPINYFSDDQILRIKDIIDTREQSIKGYSFKKLFEEYTGLYFVKTAEETAGAGSSAIPSGNDPCDMRAGDDPSARYLLSGNDPCDMRADADPSAGMGPTPVWSVTAALAAKDEEKTMAPC